MRSLQLSGCFLLFAQIYWLWKLWTLQAAATFYDQKTLTHDLSIPLPATLGSQSSWTSNTSSLFAAKLCTLPHSLCVPPFLTLREAFVRKVLVVPKYRMLSCILPKCMSTTTTRIFSYLHDPESYKSFNWTRAVKSATHHVNDFDGMQTMQQNLHLSDRDLSAWAMVTSVRHPLDRFVSAFIDKCIVERRFTTLDPLLYGGGELCYGCQDDLGCFLRRQFERAKIYAKGGLGRLSYEDQHTFPQNWFCDFHKHLSKFRVHKQTSNGRGRFRSIMQDVMRAQGVPEPEFAFVDDNILLEQKPKRIVDRTRKLADESKKRILGDRDLLKTFISLYYYDFVVFDFELPDLGILRSPIDRTEL